MDDDAKWCGNCKFYQETDNPDDVGKLGFCGRYPPVLVLPDRASAEVGWRSPLVSYLDTCGEHKRRPHKRPFFELYETDGDGQTSWPLPVV